MSPNGESSDVAARISEADLAREEARAWEARLAQAERDRAIKERDVLLSSSIWRATWPLRAVGLYLPLGVRRAARTGITFAWWSITRQLSARRASAARFSNLAKPSQLCTSSQGNGQPRSATAARIDCRKIPKVRPETSLFVTHSPDGHLMPHVQRYVDALVREGVGVVLIAAVDREFVADERWLYDLVDGLFIRANEGFDFAAWAHVLRLHPQFLLAKTLYLLNDSVIGPVTDATFHSAMERVRRTPGDLVGLTENYDRGWHIQSYFLALRERALRSAAWRRFVQKIVSFADKEEVINAYEVRLASAMATAGLRTSVVFKTGFHSDPTVYRWRELLGDGFPFVKIKTIRDEIPGADMTGWRQALTVLGFDISIADEVLAKTMTTCPPVGSPCTCRN